jgi:hypothetical protein
MFGKLMSVSDELMWRYYLLLTDLAPEQIQAKRDAVASGALHPKEAKMRLASLIVADFHGADEARAAAEAFERRFTRKEVPADAPEHPMVRQTSIERLLVDAGLASSGSDASRKVQQGAVRIDGEKFTAVRARLDRSEPFVLQVGRHVRRVVVIGPADIVLLRASGVEEGGWVLMRNGDRAAVVAGEREAALAQARELAAGSDVYSWESGRVLRAGVDSGSSLP